MKPRRTVMVLVGLGFFAVVWLLVWPNFIRCRNYGPLTACKSNLKNIGTALEMYSTDYSGHYPRNLGMLVPNYLKAMPICPTAGYVTYRAEFGPSAPGNEKDHFEDFYLLECTGAHHLDYRYPADYPKYNGIEGLIEPPRL